MHPRQVIPSALRRLAFEQAGVVTREQAIGLGFGASGVRRLVGDGWTRLARGVYLTSTPPAGWLSLAWAGVEKNSVRRSSNVSRVRCDGVGWSSSGPCGASRPQFRTLISVRTGVSGSLDPIDVTF